ncbi:DUF427 domain-containing protein [Carbonactinospora thermoautotrophica]|nr:DUF427 domain-containing protein [Carbonactinospora thermoautotrophica]
MNTTMGLMIGTAPFGERPGGVFNAQFGVPRHLLYFEDCPRRVRAVFAGETVADSRRVKLLHETGLTPVYYFPIEDVRTDLLVPSQLRTRCPVKGEASYWSVVVGDRTAPDAVWAYEQPLESAAWLAGYVAFYWDRMDAWYEEDEQVFGHPRDPYHRVDVRASSRHVRVLLLGQVVAESRRPKLLFETGLPPRYYLPAEDVCTDLLEPTDQITRCPYKGEARYWSVRVDGTVVPNLVWSYPKPYPEAADVAGLFCFLNERVDLEVDGELQERPVTRWS